MKVIENNENINYYILSPEYQEILERVTECTFDIKKDLMIVTSRRFNSMQQIKRNNWEHTIGGFIPLFIDGNNKDNWSRVAIKMYVTPINYDYYVKLM